MDIASVTAVLGSIKTATEIAQYIKNSDLSLEKAETKLKLAELIGALADAKLEVVGVQETLAGAEVRIRELERQLRIREKLTWKEPAYWLEANGKTEGPYCQKCYDTETKLVRLQGDGDGRYECKACNSNFVTKAWRERQDAAIRQHNERQRGRY